MTSNLVKNVSAAHNPFMPNLKHRELVLGYLERKGKFGNRLNHNYAVIAALMDLSFHCTRTHFSINVLQ